MMEPYILMIIGLSNGQINIQYMELQGQSTCENAKRVVNQTQPPADLDVIALCFPKEVPANVRF